MLKLPTCEDNPTAYKAAEKMQHSVPDMVTQHADQPPAVKNSLAKTHDDNVVFGKLLSQLRQYN